MVTEGAAVADDVVGQLLTSDGLHGQDLTVVEWTAPPDADGGFGWQTPRHVHHEDEELWYVLAGRLAVELDSVVHELEPGGVAMARAGVAHRFGVVGHQPARYLLVMRPRIAALVAALHDPELAAGRDVAQLFADHRSSLLE